MLAARITFAHLAAAVGVRGDNLKRSATDALVTGALHSQCQLLANACMASHKATRGLDLAEPRPSSALGGVCAVQLVAGEAARRATFQKNERGNCERHKPLLKSSSMLASFGLSSGCTSDPIFHC